MQILLLSSNPSISHIISLSAKKMSYEFTQKAKFEGNEEYFDFIVLDAEIQANLSSFKNKCKKLIYLASRDENIENLINEASVLRKPFLPSDFLQLLNEDSGFSNKNSQENLNFEQNDEKEQEKFTLEKNEEKNLVLNLEKENQPLEPNLENQTEQNFANEESLSIGLKIQTENETSEISINQNEILEEANENQSQNSENLAENEKLENSKYLQVEKNEKAQILDFDLDEQNLNEEDVENENFELENQKFKENQAELAQQIRSELKEISALDEKENQNVIEILRAIENGDVSQSVVNFIKQELNQAVQNALKNIFSKEIKIDIKISINKDEI